MAEDSIYNRHLDVFLLWACRETGILEELLDGPVTAPDVAENAGVTDRAATVSLAALAEMGYADESDGGYKATAELDGFRPETDVLERGILPHRIDSLDHYMDLPELMETGEAPEHTEAGLRRYMAAMATIDDTTVRSIVTTAEHAHPRPGRVLDVGGGPGKISEEFARRGADVTTLDIPPVVDLLESHHAEAGLDVVAGDARESLPGGFDLVVSARMILSFSPEELQTYFENAFDALEPGGTFMCTERVWDRSEIATNFAVHMLTVSPNGHMYTEAEYREALEAAGFVDTDVREVPETPFQGIIGHRPE
jgi:2-polyprenyl-3-methyl-5-hydroxy-6-metoxy-1,4-benzoquinol methylase